MRSVEGAAGGRTDRDRDQRLWRGSASKRPPAAEHGLTVPAGAGKTTLCAAIAAAVAEPLMQRRGAVIGVAGKLSNKELILADHVIEFLKPWTSGRPLTDGGCCYPSR